MSEVLSREEIFFILREIVVECVGCEHEEVTPEANFRYDLGGESIDDLDLMFRCEKRFGLRLRFQDLQNPSLWERDNSGHLSGESLNRMRQLFPNLDLSDLESHSGPVSPHDFLKIKRIVQLIEQAQATAALGKVTTRNEVAPQSV